MSVTNIVITTVDSAAMVLDQLNPQPNADSDSSLNRLSRYIEGLGDGAFYYTTVTENVGAIAATGTITLSSFVDEDTITIANVVLSGETVPSGNAEFAIGASDTITAANAVVVINANPTLQPLVTATSSGAVITLTAVSGGTVGNFLTIAISAHGSVSGSGLLTGGTVGTFVTLK